MRLTRIVLLLLLLAPTLTGCATMAKYRAERAKYQAMADQATTQLHVASVYVQPMAGMRGRYICASRTIELGTDQTARGLRFLLAHELGHHVDGRCGNALPQEVSANLLAVRVMQTWGFTESQALADVMAILMGAARDGRMRGMPGHDACAELVAVLRAYPNAIDPRGTGDRVCLAEEG